MGLTSRCSRRNGTNTAPRDAVNGDHRRRPLFDDGIPAVPALDDLAGTPPPKLLDLARLHGAVSSTLPHHPCRMAQRPCPASPKREQGYTVFSLPLPSRNPAIARSNGAVKFPVGATGGSGPAGGGWSPLQAMEKPCRPSPARVAADGPAALGVSTRPSLSHRKRRRAVIFT
jgi:hypothetical protein